MKKNPVVALALSATLLGALSFNEIASAQTVTFVPAASVAQVDATAQPQVFVEWVVATAAVVAATAAAVQAYAAVTGMAVAAVAVVSSSSSSSSGGAQWTPQNQMLDFDH